MAPRTEKDERARERERRVESARAASPWYDTAEAAAYTRRSKRGLEGLRMRGGGPPFSLVGRRVVYHRAGLDRWLEAGLRRSTSDPGPDQGSV